MSEFTCSNGHLMAPSMGPTCHICGSRVALMDGKSSRQLAAEDEWYDQDCEECGQQNKDHDDGECPKKYRED